MRRDLSPISFGVFLPAARAESTALWRAGAPSSCSKKLAGSASKKMPVLRILLAIIPRTHECMAKDPNRPALDGLSGEKPQALLANRSPVQARDPHWITSQCQTRSITYVDDRSCPRGCWTLSIIHRQQPLDQPIDVCHGRRRQVFLAARPFRLRVLNSTPNLTVRKMRPRNPLVVARPVFP